MHRSLFSRLIRVNLWLLVPALLFWLTLRNTPGGVVPKAPDKADPLISGAERLGADYGRQFGLPSFPSNSPEDLALRQRVRETRLKAIQRMQQYRTEVWRGPRSSRFKATRTPSVRNTRRHTEFPNHQTVGPSSKSALQIALQKRMSASTRVSSPSDATEEPPAPPK